MLQALDSVAITLAGARFSLRDVLQTLVTVMVFVVVAAYTGGLIERRLMAAQELPIGVRVGVAKATRLLLITIAVLLSFNLLGVDLGGLAVFSGALGVGIGFGLQRIASNFVSGFILIGDRSIRPGDVITIGERFGVVRELRARYVVVRDRDGVDTLIPNENIITSEVINWSYADRSIRLTMPVQISYQDDPRRALELMTAAAAGSPEGRAFPAAGRARGGVRRERHRSRAALLDPRPGGRHQQRSLGPLSRDLGRLQGRGHQHPVPAAGRSPAIGRHAVGKGRCQAFSAERDCIRRRESNEEGVRRISGRAAMTVASDHHRRPPLRGSRSR